MDVLKMFNDFSREFKMEEKRKCYMLKIKAKVRKEYFDKRDSLFFKPRNKH